MKKALLIVDVQNDFVTGSLGSDYARDVIVPNIKSLAKEFDYRDRYATLDSHVDKDYLNSHEGKRLPIKHCIVGTKGHDLVKEIKRMIPSDPWHMILKGQFSVSHIDLYNAFTRGCGFGCDYDEIHVCGLVTDICVISNVLALRSIFKEKDIIVHESCCAGTSKEAHDAAIKVMKSCQIDIV